MENQTQKLSSPAKMLAIMMALGTEVLSGMAVNKIAAAVCVSDSGVIQTYLQPLLDMGWAEKTESGNYRLAVNFYSFFSAGLKISEMNAVELLMQNVSMYRAAAKGE